MRFQILYRFPDKSASNCSIVCSSTPAAPRLDLTALYASYTKRLSILNGLFVACIEFILFSSCFAKCDHLTRPLCFRPITGPSSLIRVGPSQCSASVLSSRSFGRLDFSLSIGANGSCSSVRSPASASRPLYAGRHLLSHQAPSRFIPEEIHASGFDDTLIS